MTVFLVRLCLATAWLAALPALALAQSAAVQSVSVGQDLLDKREDYGAREIDHLQTSLREDVEQALDRAGLLGADGPEVRVSLALEDAWPNRPTRAQLSAQPGLSFQSLSRGGAQLTATLRDAEGNEVARLAYDWRTRALEDSAHRSTWSDAERAFERFADRVVDAVAEIEAGA